MLIALDYDGVVVDSLDRLTRLAKRAQAEIGHGRQPEHDDFRNLANMAFPDLARAIGIDDSEIERFSSRMFELQGLDDSFPNVFPGMPPLMRQIAQSGIIVIVTSSLDREVRHVLQENGLDDTISLVMDGTDVRSKGERIRAAVEQFGSDRSSTFMIGDAGSDIRQGKLAGVKTIAATWGYQSREFLAAENPDYLVDYPNEIAKIIGVEQLP